MINYIFKRLIGLVPTLLGITIITFTVIHLAPGKPTDLQTQLNPKVSLQARERMEKLYGLDKPLHIQYINWIKKLIKLANHLDSKGLAKEADYLDGIITKISKRTVRTSKTKGLYIISDVPL